MGVQVTFDCTEKISNEAEIELFELCVMVNLIVERNLIGSFVEHAYRFLVGDNCSRVTSDIMLIDERFSFFIFAS